MALECPDLPIENHYSIRSAWSARLNIEEHIGAEIRPGDDGRRRGSNADCASIETHSAGSGLVAFRVSDSRSFLHRDS
jgi:hypothetical protein